MEQVFVVTDSTADIPRPLVEELGIAVVPLKIHFGREVFLDGETITPAEFYRKLREADSLPTTSQPSPLDFVKVYQEIAERKEGVRIVSIHLSSALSGTCQSAAIAREMLAGKVDVTVIDSRKASYAAGMIAVNVAEAAKAGKSKEYCVAKARYLVENTHVYFLVDTLNFLQKGGRIGKAASLLGSLLNIKPILSLDPAGEVYVKGKVRGTKKALERILELLKEDARSYRRFRLGIMHAAAEEEANRLKEELKGIFGVGRLVVAEIGAVIGTHAGPGTVAVALSADDFGMESR